MSSTRPARTERPARTDRADRTARPARRHDNSPRGPLVLDTRELGRRPGSMLEVHREVPAPAELGTPMIGVPEDATLHLDARLESVVEGVLVTAQVTAPLRGECARCLEAFDSTAQVRVLELFSYPERLADLDADDDEETPVMSGDLLDLEGPVRDALVLDLPLSPLCRPDCPGLTMTGERRGEVAGAEPIDARWAALRALVQPGD